MEVVLLVLAASAGRPVRAQAPITFQYAYEDNGQLVKVFDSTGVTIEYVYDQVGNMVRIKRFTASPGALRILSFAPQASSVAMIAARERTFHVLPTFILNLFDT